MNIYLTSIATNHCELGNRTYKSLDSSLKHIYNNLKALSSEYICDCAFFDREYVQEYFTEEFFSKFNGRMNCKSAYGEFYIEKISDTKYQFVFAPLLITDVQNTFIVCELEILELL